MSNNTVTVEVDLEEVAKRVQAYYSTMQDGQLAEMFGETGKAFQAAKEVIGELAGLLDYALGPENVGKVHDLMAAAAPADN